MVYTAFGEMFEVLAILEFSLLLGFFSGLAILQVLRVGGGRLSLRALMGLIVIAAMVCCLVAAKPRIWVVTLGSWILASTAMALADLIASHLAERFRATPLFPEHSRNRMRMWFIPGLVVVVLSSLAFIHGQFVVVPADLLLLAGVLTATIFVLIFIDFIVRLSAITMGRWRRTWTKASPQRT